MPYLSASAVMIHYEEALYQVYAPLPISRASRSRGKGERRGQRGIGSPQYGVKGTLTSIKKPPAMCFVYNGIVT